MQKQGRVSSKVHSHTEALPSSDTYIVALLLKESSARRVYTFVTAESVQKTSNGPAPPAGHFSFAVSPVEAATDLNIMFERLDDVLESNKDTVTDVHAGWEGATCDNEELYGPFAAEQGLLVSRVLQGTSTIFENKEYLAWKQVIESDSFNSSTAATSSSQQREDSSVSTASGAPSLSTKDDRMLKQIQSIFDQFQDLSTATKSPTLPEMLQKCLKSPTGQRRPILKGKLSVKNRSQTLSFDPQAKIVPKAPIFPPESAKSDVATSALGCYEMEPLPEMSKVAIVSGRNNSFCGALPFTRTDCMLFDETCTLTNIAESMMSGGLIFCRGRGCTVAFYNCFFHSCPVIALEGAVVTFDTCSFGATQIKNAGEHADYAVFASGEGTYVSIADCTFSHSEYRKEACVVQQGARMHIDQCQFPAFSRTSIRASGKHTKLSCRRCVIHNGPTSVDSMLSTPQKPYRGISVCEGARGVLWGCKMNDLVTGVCVVNATADIQDTWIEDPEYAGLGVHSNSTVTVSCTRFICAINSDSGHGVLVDGGSTLAMNWSFMINNRRSGLKASDGAKLSLRHCEVTQMIADGVWVTGEGVVLAVLDSVVRGARNGFHLEGCKDINLRRVRCNDHYQSVTIVSAQRCSMMECTVQEYVRSGVSIDGNCGPVTLKQCTFSRSKGECLSVQGDVHVSAEACTMCPGPVTIGASVSVLGAGATLSLSNCTISAKTGVSCNAARLTMKDCKTYKCKYTAIDLVEGASASITRHTSKSDDTVLSCRGSVVHAKSCEFVDFVTGAIFIGKSESVSSMHDCKLVSRPGIERSTGVLVNAEKISANLTKCVIRSLGRSAVAVESMEGILNIHDCDFSEVAMGDGVQVLCDKAKVFLKRCNIHCTGGFGLQSVRGHVVAERVHTERNAGGGYVMYEGGCMNLTDCSSFRDGWGVVSAPSMCEGGHVPEMSLRRVFVRKSFKDAVSIKGAIRCEISNCSVLQSSGRGFVIEGRIQSNKPAVFAFPGSSQNSPAQDSALPVRIVNSRAQGCSEEGFLCKENGKLTLRNAVAVRNSGSGFACYDVGSDMQLFRCQSTGNGAEFLHDDKAVLRVAK